ncbi:hypothetical protein Tco_1222684 [Tanacetum coccineum]
MGDANPIRTLGDYSKPSHEGYSNTIELPEGNNVVPLRSDTIRLVQNGCSFHGLRSEDPNQHLKDFLKLVNSLNLNEDIALYDNESWNDPRDFAKQVKAISLPQYVSSISDRRLIELETQLQRLDGEVSAALLLTETYSSEQNQFFIVRSEWSPRHSVLHEKFTSLGEYASFDARLSKFEADFKQQQSEMTNKIDTVLKAITDRIAGALPSDTVKNLKLNVNSTTLILKVSKLDSFLESSGLVPQSSDTEIVCTEGDDGDVMFIDNQPNETYMNDLKPDDESVDTPFVSPFPHSDNDSDDGEVLYELSEYKNAGSQRRERIINGFDGDDLAFQCMIGFRKFVAYLDPFLPINIISRKAYNTIMVEGLEGTRNNLVAIVKDVYVFVESFTYITDFVVLKDIGEFIMSDMAEVLMGKPFRKTTKLKYDVAKGLVLFTKIFDAYIFKMPRTIPRLRNFKWNKVPALKFLIKNKEEIFTVRGEGVEIKPDGVASPAMLYLTRRSLEVLRKFHWTTLGGGSNQLSHVSSPLLSKPMEY